MIWRTPKYTGPERRKTKRRRPRPLRALFSLIAIAVFGYAGVVLWLIREESSFVLEAGRTLGPGRPPFRYEQIDIRRTDGARQFAWVMPRAQGGSGPWTLFLHGNASTIASTVNIAHYRELRGVGLGVFAPEYRGFGGLDGTPSVASLRQDADAAYAALRAMHDVTPSKIVIFGWSLGSAVAIDLAERVELGALILEGAPASQAGLSERRYPFFPVRLLMRSQFDSIGRIAHIRSPVLFLHSPDDAVIPIAEGRRLFEAAPADKTFVEVRGGHVDAAGVDAAHFSAAIREFLKQHGLLTAAPAPAMRP